MPVTGAGVGSRTRNIGLEDPYVTVDTTPALLVREAEIGPAPQTRQVRMLPLTTLSHYWWTSGESNPNLVFARHSCDLYTTRPYWCFRPNSNRDSKAENLCSLPIRLRKHSAPIGSCTQTQGAKTPTPYC